MKATAVFLACLVVACPAVLAHLPEGSAGYDGSGYCSGAGCQTTGVRTHNLVWQPTPNGFGNKGLVTICQGDNVAFAWRDGSRNVVVSTSAQAPCTKPGKVLASGTGTQAKPATFTLRTASAKTGVYPIISTVAGECTNKKMYILLNVRKC